MTQDPFDDPTESERAAFRALPRTMPPPAGLEGRVVAALRSESLLRARSLGGFGTVPWSVRVGVVAAMLVFFAAGVVTGRVAPRPVEPEDPRPQFVLLLQEGKKFEGGADHAAEYSAWARSLRARGLIVAGEKLKDDAVVLSGKDAGGTIETEAITLDERAPRGYFVIRARNLDEAIAIARDCPHLKHGGRISLRPIDKI
jgi:hypothetical protein